ncbi:MAG: hypothetical protein KDJ52_12015 [Anaerolineae bacterium]|nr:hypothetical protein [Anaerolineae bacterium]
MFYQRMSNRAKLAVIATIAVIAIITLSGAALANSNCMDVEGSFTLQPVTENCTSPVELCAKGKYKGDLKASSNFTGLAFIPTEDTPTTGVLFFTGDNIIHAEGGDILTKDFISFNTVGKGDFGEVDAIVGGTGAWDKATGYIRAIGTFPAGGNGQGKYVGEICTP